MHTFLLVLLVLFSLVLVIAVLMQPSKSQGLGGLVTGTTDTFFSRNKSRTSEALMAKITVVSAVLFAGVIIALNLLK